MSDGVSRIQAARERAASAKATVLVGAVLAFFASLFLAAWTRPAAAVAHRQAVSASETESDDSFSIGPWEEGSGSGAIAPGQSVPQVRTGSS